MNSLAYLAQQEREKQRAVSLLEATLHPNQMVIKNDQQRFKLVRCGRKFRKTSLFVEWQIENALKCTKGLSYPVILPFQEQARESVWLDHVKRILFELDKIGIKYRKNETGMSLEFDNGARLKLLGSNNEIALRSISNWGAVACDEYDDWGTRVWDSVIRPNLMTHQAPAMVGGTPKGLRNMHELSQRSEWKEYHYTSYDNPELSKEELDDLVMKAKEKGDDYFEQEIMAEYVRPYGMVYKDWPLENFKEVNYDANLDVHITLDFGVNDPTSVVWIQNNGSEVRVIDYYEASDANIEHFVQVIRSKPYKEPSLITGDPAGKSRTLTTGTSPIEIMAQKGLYVRTKDGVKIPDQIRAVHSFAKSLFVSDKLARFRDCLLNYRYPEIKDTARNQENEIPIHDEFSHAMRALEYYAVNVKGINQFRKRKQIVGYRGGDPTTGYGRVPIYE